ncbi:MAG TPA: hypothetical protein EYQ22_05695 [Gammaproteobacteria bacterium]|nr:hypothetical protein [Gammaproteobacteria bacterium]HIK71066.1 hypothetical protein [Pseudomonadales bacterium]|tara:strand:- start:955 stop:1230 length:276 start_codon:yes stop_codon:yes gene_type:complete
MKKIIQQLVIVIAMVILAQQQQAEALKQTTHSWLTDSMFVDADSDAFNPGIATGEDFPLLMAVYQGRTVSDLQSFMGDKGMIFIASRSVDW